MGKLALVLVSLAAFAAGIAACGEEKEVTPAASKTPGTSETPAVSVTPGPSPTPAATSGSLPACPTPGPGRTFQYQPITSGETKGHTDSEAGYSVTFPADWTICKVAFDSGIRDFSSAIELYDTGGLLRISVYVYKNPMKATLEEWIKDHDAAFFDRPPETRAIGGVEALVEPLNFEGQPAPSAYLQHRSFVVGIQGLTTEDFDAIVSKFSLR